MQICVSQQAVDGLRVFAPFKEITVSHHSEQSGITVDNKAVYLTAYLDLRAT